MNKECFKNRKLFREIRRNRYIYLILSAGIVWLLIFSYIPMGGLILAFKQYKPKLGVIGSPFVGLKHFKRLFAEEDFIRAFWNTIEISFGRIIWQFPVAIIIAVLISEMKNGKFKKVIQTIFTLPHFMSWVIVAVIISNVFEYDGIINNLIVSMGGKAKLFLADKGIFRSLLYFSDNWKESGWSSIIYLSAIAAISNDLYEAAHVDGANRWQRIIHITLPGIRSTMVTMLLLSIGNTMNAGFDQVFNMYNPAVQSVSDIIDTYIYRITFQSGCNFGFSTAVGFLKSIINFVLLLGFDRIAKRFGEKGIME